MLLQKGSTNQIIRIQGIPISLQISAGTLLKGKFIKITKMLLLLWSDRSCSTWGFFACVWFIDVIFLAADLRLTRKYKCEYSINIKKKVIIFLFWQLYRPWDHNLQSMGPFFVVVYPWVFLGFSKAVDLVTGCAFFVHKKYNRVQVVTLNLTLIL